MPPPLVSCALASLSIHLDALGSSTIITTHSSFTPTPLLPPPSPHLAPPPAPAPARYEHSRFNKDCPHIQALADDNLYPFARSSSGILAFEAGAEPGIELPPKPTINWLDITEADITKESVIDHLLLVVHGIGETAATRTHRPLVRSSLLILIHSASPISPSNFSHPSIP